jgi:hypothetical protein
MFSLAGVVALVVGGLAHAQSSLPVLAPVPVNPTPVSTPKKAKPHEKFANERAPIQPVQAYTSTGADVSAGEYQFLVTPPGPERLFELEPESGFQARLQNEWRDNGHKDRLTFPDEPVLSKNAYAGRSWPEYTLTVEPNFVAYRRLLFQQINTERYGWDLGIIDPPLSAGLFFADVALLPYHAFTDPFRCIGDTGAGYCLPGDPVPYLLYPPEYSLTGAVAEAGAVGAVLAIFP